MFVFACVLRTEDSKNDALETKLSWILNKFGFYIDYLVHDLMLCMAAIYIQTLQNVQL